jgi:hypothetical protein
LHFCIGGAFCGFPHKSLNNSAEIIISPFLIDFSRDKNYIHNLVENGGKGVKNARIENENYFLHYSTNRL